MTELVVTLDGLSDVSASDDPSATLATNEGLCPGCGGETLRVDWWCHECLHEKCLRAWMETGTWIAKYPNSPSVN